MVEIEISTDEIVAVMDDMLAKIRHFKAVDMGMEMSAWQTDDMHRHRPFTMRYRRAGKAVTKIRPHSKYEMVHSTRYQQRMERRTLRTPRGRRRKPVFWEPLTSTRPILRQELEQTLGHRMGGLLEEKLVWK